MLWVDWKNLGFQMVMLFRYEPSGRRSWRPLTFFFYQLGPERFRAPEILFNPELIGQEYAGVHQVVVDSINRVDLDLRKSLFSNIVLSGGSTLCKGKCYG
jgi:actin-related protein